MGDHAITLTWGFLRGGISIPGAEGKATLRLGDGRTREITLAGSDWWPAEADWDFIGEATDVTIAGVSVEIDRGPF